MLQVEYIKYMVLELYTGCKMSFKRKPKDQHVQKPIYNSSTTDFILLWRVLKCLHKMYNHPMFQRFLCFIQVTITLPVNVKEN